MARKRGQNEGSIFQRESDGRWCGVLNLGWENGRRKRKYFYATTAAEVQQKLLDEKSKEGFSPQTVTNVRTVIRSALSQAVKWNLVSRNSAALVNASRI